MSGVFKKVDTIPCQTTREACGVPAGLRLRKPTTRERVVCQCLRVAQANHTVKRCGYTALARSASLHREAVRVLPLAKQEVAADAAKRRRSERSDAGRAGCDATLDYQAASKQSSPTAAPQVKNQRREAAR